jgi:hypothetical protein
MRFELSPGLYANEKGQLVVLLFFYPTYTDVQTNNPKDWWVNYRLLLPKLAGESVLRTDKFLRKYPLPVTELLVDPEAEKATDVRTGKLYTDGVEVFLVASTTDLWRTRLARIQKVYPTVVERSHSLYVDFMLTKYPWELDLSCLVLE